MARKIFRGSTVLLFFTRDTWHFVGAGRGVPAYTQSTQLRTLIFECPKIKNVLNRENAIKTCPTRVKSLNTEVYRFCDNPEPNQ